MCSLCLCLCAHATTVLPVVLALSLSLSLVYLIPCITTLSLFCMHCCLLARLLSIQVKQAHRVEVVTNLVGTTIICKNSSPDMYESIDQAAHALQRKLRKYKERRTDGWHAGNAKDADTISGLQEALDALEDDAEEEEEEFVDPYKRDVTKVKSFQLDHAVSLEEAVFSLDYVDHDFYVFRNKETNKVNVVYKLHTGGVGHVEP